MVMYTPDPRTGHTVEDVSGWEGFRFEHVEIALVDGQPRLVAVNIRPVFGTPVGEVVLDRARMARFPASEIVSLVAPFALGGDIDLEAVTDALRSLSDPHRDVVRDPSSVVRPRGGSEEFSRAVEAVVLGARARGKNAIPTVAQTWHVSEDRANQYIREARRVYGLLPRDGRQRSPVNASSDASRPYRPDEPITTPPGVRTPWADTPPEELAKLKELQSPETRDARIGRSRGKNRIRKDS